MMSDVYHAADNHSRSLLLQLDLSAAFDTLDKPTLLRRLDNTFGVRGTSHKWVDSYFNRTQSAAYVRVDDRVSASVSCHYGVPQGSVLGPLLFTIYTSPIVSVIVSIPRAAIAFLANLQFLSGNQIGEDRQTVNRGQGPDHLIGVDP